MGRRVKEDMLVARWDKKERDIMFHYPSKSDGSLLCNVLTSKRHHPFTPEWSDSLVEELEKRGYDITTLRFSIKKNAPKESAQTNVQQDGSPKLPEQNIIEPATSGGAA